MKQDIDLISHSLLIICDVKKDIYSTSNAAELLWCETGHRLDISHAADYL